MSARSPETPRTILITGATSGLGRALALRYAQAGTTVVLHGRDAARLGAIESECAAKGAAVVAFPADLRQVDAFLERLAAIDREQPIDLALVNAGVSLADRGNGEAWEDIAALLDVNVRAAIATASFLAAAMRVRGRGQVALVSSLAAWHGLPLTPTYCASKAALKAYAEALRAGLAPHGVAVNAVLPGFVRTPMSDAYPGPRPFLVEAEEAARIIERGLARNQARIAFPQPLAFGTWLLGALPAALSQRLVRRLRF